nr:hypothetical protein [Candidatus Delongbacteria bacterium]
MKNYLRSFNTRVIFQIMLICINLSVNIYLLLSPSKNYFIIAFIFIVLIYQIDKLLRLMHTTNRDFIRFLEAIEYSDLTQSFSDKKMGKSFLELNTEFNKVIEKFKQSKLDKEKNLRYTKNIIEYINNGLVSYDQDGNVEFLNRACKKILNLGFLKNINSLKNSHPDIYELLNDLKHGDKIVKKIKFNDE